MSEEDIAALKDRIAELSDDVLDLNAAFGLLRRDIKELSDSVFRLLHFVEEDHRKIRQQNNGSVS